MFRVSLGQGEKDIFGNEYGAFCPRQHFLNPVHFASGSLRVFPLQRDHAKNLSEAFLQIQKRGFPTSIKKIKLLKSCLNPASYFELFKVQ